MTKRMASASFHLAMQRLPLSSRASRLKATTFHRRTLWQCATYTSPSPASLLERVEQKIAEAPSDVTLFALSKNVPQQLVDDFRRVLSSSSSKGTTIGCLSEVLPTNSSPSSAEAETFSIAIAQHRPAHSSERTIAFRSTLLGRPNIALGREIKPEYQADHDQVDSGLEAFLKGGSWGFGEQTPEQKSSQHEIEELKGEECVKMP